MEFYTQYIFCGCLYSKKLSSSGDADDDDGDAHLPQQPRVEYNASNQAVSMQSRTGVNNDVDGDNYFRLQPSDEIYFTANQPYQAISELPLAATSPTGPTKPSSYYTPAALLPQPPDSADDAQILDSHGYLYLR